MGACLKDAITKSLDDELASGDTLVSTPASVSALTGSGLGYVSATQITLPGYFGTASEAEGTDVIELLADDGCTFLMADDATTFLTQADA